MILSSVTRMATHRLGRTMNLPALSTLLFVAIASSSAGAEAPRGQAEYLRYCSACHGESADGKGPVANVLEPHPPALTRLHEKFGRPLGTDLVAFVMGTSMPRAHGTSDMPVWGKVLATPEGDDEPAIRIIWRIVDYLESIQPRQ